MTSLSRPTDPTGLLLPIIPALAWAAFPFFSDFTTPKLLVGALLSAPLCWVLATEAVKVRALVLPGLLLLASLPALFWGVSGTDVRGALVLEALVLVVYWAATLTGREFLEALPDWLLAAAVGVIALRGAEWAWPEGPFAIGALSGSATLGNPDLVAEFLACLLPVAFWQLRRPGWPGRYVAAGVVAGSLLIIYHHHSVTALLAALMGAGVLALSALTDRPRIRGLALLSLVLLIAAGLWWGRNQGEIAGRRFLYSVAADVALASPIGGHGEGGFGAAFMAVQGKRLQEDAGARRFWTNARDAHCAPLHIWIERGPVAALLLLVFWGMGFWHCRRGPAWPSAVLAGVVLVSLGSVSWNHVPFRMLAYMLMGAAWAGGRASVESGSGPPVAWRRLVAVGGMGILVGLSGWQAAGDAAFVRGDLEQAMVLMPDDGRVQFAMGQALVDQERDQEAAAILEASLASHPNLSTLLTLGNIETRRGRFERAEKWYRQLLDWKPDFAAAYGNLAWLYHLWGKPELARRHMVRALSLRPSDPAILRISQRLGP